MHKLVFFFIVALFSFLPSPAYAINVIDYNYQATYSADIAIDLTGHETETEDVSSLDKISSFTSEVIINQDTSITIKETIKYKTDVPKHGIFRYIPVRYSRNNISYTTKIKDVTITDEQGNPIPYERSYDTPFLTYKIGDPDTTFQGEKTYIITYTVENAVKRYAKYDELYWDITGEGWQIPIDYTHATVHSPHAIVTTVICYSGDVGTTDQLCRYSHTDDQATFTYDQTVTYGKNVTMAVALNQNNSTIQFPSTTEEIIKTITDNWLLLPIVSPAVVMFLLWYLKGRDYVFLSPNIYNLDPSQPKKHKPLLFYVQRTPFVYEPFKGITPGQAGTILDEKTDNHDVVAEIIDLARKKYLKIETMKTDGFLGIGGSTDYILTRLKYNDGKLPKHQDYLLSHLFDNSKSSVKLSQLKGKFYQHMQRTKELLYDSVTKEQLFTRNPSTVKAIYITFVILINAALFFYVIYVSEQLLTPVIPFIIFAVQALISLLFALDMPQKTAVGTNVMLQAKGLKRTIKYGKWRETIAEKNLFIQDVLPFAISLGVVKQLAKDMEALHIPPPSYLHTATFANINTNEFVNSFNSQVASTLTYNPSSSSWSGGSGFSGGSSGGGGGGGGGGSW